MSYFDQDFIDFFLELSQNNRKEWFDENRKRYEKKVKEPFKQLVADTIVQIQKFDPEIFIEPKNAIFRINRDIRFSNDKRPYKNNVAAVFSKTSKKEEFPAYYLHLSPHECYVGGGMYSMSKETLYKVRQEILYNPEEFNGLLNDAAFKSTFGEIKGEKNKILKPPFKEAADEIPLLFNKQYYFMKDWPTSIITEEKLDEKLANAYEKAFPLVQFFRRALDE
jgi:uncharacterized protein (TIGR02453 family)